MLDSANTAHRPFSGARAVVLLVPALAGLIGVGTLAGCGGGNGGAAVSPAALAEARDIFKMRCATCHGEKGAGDGPGAAALDPKPRDFRDPAWQKSVTDEHIKKVIVGGGAAVGKSPAMAPNPDLKGKDATLSALVAHVRSLSK